MQAKAGNGIDQCHLHLRRLPYFSLICKLVVPVQCREYENGLVRRCGVSMYLIFVVVVVVVFLGNSVFIGTPQKHSSPQDACF